MVTGTASMTLDCARQRVGNRAARIVSATVVIHDASFLPTSPLDQDVEDANR
jgi:hypothetical protein